MSALNDVGWANLLTMILVVVTGVYVLLTWRIANANQKMLERVEEQHREQVRPVVYAYLEFREQVVARLVVENMGRTPAYGLTVRISEDFHQFGEIGRGNLRDLPIFSEEISWFPPNAKISVDLEQGFNFDKEIDGKNITPSSFDVSLEYSSKFDSYTEICEIDLAPYGNMHIAKTAAEQLGKIEEHLRKMSAR